MIYIASLVLTQSIGRIKLFPFQGRIQAGFSSLSSLLMKIGSMLRPFLPSWPFE